jgi:hypothetical protein
MSSPLPPDGPGLPAPINRSLPSSYIPERSGVTVWWSNIKREGEWILPRKFRIFTCMGNVELDLSHARMSSDVSEIEIRCVLANVEISVTPDIRVIVEGDGIGGNFETVRIGEIDPTPVDAPTVKITGAAYLGSVTVKILGRVGPGWKDKLKAWTALNG